MIRSEPKWAARALATTAQGYFVDTIKDVDDTWVEVAYEDGDVRVHGYVSKHEPPGRVHRPHDDENVQVIAPNGRLLGGTCLYGHEGGEAIGYAVANSPAEITAGSHTGWFEVAIDSPWGPLAFAATGANESELATCAPTSP